MITLPKVDEPSSYVVRDRHQVAAATKWHVDHNVINLNVRDG